ncbi:MAG: SDR family oxidoreductase [Actinobacteria bacterium]|nr:SDR family oxidoreductase [Actinomycetota bacterium]
MKQRGIAGQRALVTGAASGIGRTTTLGLAREGVDLILADIRGEAMGQLAREVEALGVEAHTFCVDVTDWEQVKNMADTVHARWGAVDILVNSAGIAHVSNLVDTSLQDWQRLLDVNLWSIIHMVKAFAPDMIESKSGHIVNIASGQAFFAVPTWGSYACTKFAVDGFSEALRYELFWDGVQVTTVFPGIVRTPFYDSITGRLRVRLAMKLILATASKPETMGRLIVVGIKKKKKYVIQGTMWPIYLFKRLIPWPFEAAGRVLAWFWKGQGESSPCEEGAACST